MSAGDTKDVLEMTWDIVRAIEPARGEVGAAQVLEVRTALERVAAERAGLARLPADDRAEREGAMATVYARAAAVAIAAGEEANAERWLTEAEALSHDDDQRAELAAARRSHERYRALVHGRNLFAHDHEPAARKLWKLLTRGERDAISRAAADELKAPRPLRDRDSAPSLGRYNGVGAGFYGRRDTWSDGSYATTHCISILWIPVWPLTAWRVLDESGGYRVLAREQLSSFARLARWSVLAALVLVIAGYSITSYLADPERLARQRWDAALEVAQRGDPEAALHQLDGELARDLANVDPQRAERAGAEIVRLTAGYVATPFTADKLDQVIRVVRRYQGLPPRAQGGAAQHALVGRLDGWIHQLGDGLDTAEARLALLQAAAEVADAERKHALAAQITTTRLAIAAAKAEAWPLDALAILVGPVAGSPTGAATGAAAIDQADKIVERLLEAPSLLLDAGSDLDAWAAATTSGDLRVKATNLREIAKTGRTDAEVEGVTPKQLAEMQARRPWDQHVALQLARNDASAGALDAAAARIARLGTPGITIRDARFLLAQITAAQGKLEAADALFASLLGSRVPRFAAASAALQDTAKQAQDRIDSALRTGNVPLDLKRRYEAASESERNDLISHWVDDQLKDDAALTAARAHYLALADIVPVAIAAGSIKLRRAQALAGAARSAMLESAEHTFLAIRTGAEGQPEFRLGLGEIYARLGKTTESDAEFAAVLARNDPKLSLRVASVYRDIGSIAHAKQIAEQVFASTASPIKETAASLLGVMSEDDDDAERWYGKADPHDPYVRTALLEVEGKRLRREGKTAECAAKFAAAAKAHLEAANPSHTAGYNNAAVADEMGFSCSGDPQALRDAVAALEIAYRNMPDDPIVTGNLAVLLESFGELRVLARHLDARALRLDQSEISDMVVTLLDSSERASLLGELAAEPNIRRGSEILAQFEVLAPNNPGAYTLRFAGAMRKRDVDAAVALVERARHAKAIDVTEAATARDRWLAGTDDAKLFASLELARARFDAALARPGLDPKTRATGLLLMARSLAKLGLYQSDAAALGRAREAASQAMRLWPVLDSNGLIAVALIDEGGLEADAKAWIAARRQRGPEAALDKLVAEHAPLAAKLRDGRPWAQVAAYAMARTRRPDLDDLRIARLLGEPAIEARTRAALDDPWVRLALELASVLDPTSPVVKEDLAYLDKR
jgi:cellulose synthase operon protein C